MKTYREWVVLVKDNLILYEASETQSTLLGEYVLAEKYQDALNKINVIQNTLEQMKTNAQKREATGVQDFSSGALASYDALSYSYNYYKDYINLLIKKETLRSWKSGLTVVWILSLFIFVVFLNNKNSLFTNSRGGLLIKIILPIFIILVTLFRWIIGGLLKKEQITN